MVMLHRVLREQSSLIASVHRSVGDMYIQEHCCSGCECGYMAHGASCGIRVSVQNFQMEGSQSLQHFTYSSNHALLQKIWPKHSAVQIVYVDCSTGPISDVSAAMEADDFVAAREVAVTASNQQ